MKILLVDDRVPDPHFGAGFPRAYRMLLSLIQLGHQVFFHPTLKQTIKELDLEKLKKFGVEVISDISEVTDINVVIMSRPHNVHYHLPLARKAFPKAKFIYDTEALWYRRYDLQLSITGKLPGWAYRYDELGMARSVDYCWVVNSTEKEILHEKGVERVKVLAHALIPNFEGLPFELRKDILVVGGILEEDSSNEDALWTYLCGAWERVQEKLNCNLNVTGKSHSKRLIESKFSNMNLMGHVNDLGPLYRDHRVFVATTRFATGIPWKVHEAMAHGIPCVISRLLADQLGVSDGKEALVADNEEQMFTKTIQLYSDQNLWHSVREQGYELVRRDCDCDRFKEIISATLNELV
jgi:glycosyltransferase involved in cell wall biosynthesis